MPGSIRKSAFWLALAFLLFCVQRILLYRVRFADSSSELFCGIVTLVFAVSVKKRVTNLKIRNVLLLISFFLLLYMLLQIMRYNPFAKATDVNRFLWYAYYIPTIALPFLCLYLSILVNRPPQKSNKSPAIILSLCAAVLICAVLTNDLHYQFKSFPNGMNTPDDQVKSGWLFYTITIIPYALYFISFIILIRKNLIYKGQKYRHLPAIVFLAGFLYFVLYPLDIGAHTLGFRLINIGEMIVFCIISSLEACIQTGMIPANTEYESLFKMTDFPAVIVDNYGEVKYATADTEYPFPQSDTLQIMSHPISGGKIEWAVDVSQLKDLNRRLGDTARQIEARNAYLTAEAKIKTEKAEIETRNQIYDNIFGIIRPRLDSISLLLENKEIPFDEQLKKISVLCAYIKRRSNMELTAENGLLPGEELSLALMEYLNFVRLCGINTAMSTTGSGYYLSAMVIAAFEQATAIIENCLDTLSDLMISVKCSAHRIALRLLLSADDLTILPDEAVSSDKGFSYTMTINKNGPDIILLLSFAEGGEQP